MTLSELGREITAMGRLAVSGSSEVVCTLCSVLALPHVTWSTGTVPLVSTRLAVFSAVSREGCELALTGSCKGKHVAGRAAAELNVAFILLGDIAPKLRLQGSSKSVG